MGPGYARGMTRSSYRQPQTAFGLLHDSFGRATYLGSGTWHHAYWLEDISNGDYVIRVPRKGWDSARHSLKQLASTTNLCTPELVVTGSNIGQPLLVMETPLDEDAPQGLSIHAMQFGESVPKRTKQPWHKRDKAHGYIDLMHAVGDITQNGG